MSTLPQPDDVFTQQLVLWTPDGQMFVTSMGEIDFMRQYGIRIAINWASQIGATLILLLVLFLLTRREKRNSWIFTMNALCLVLNSIRSVLQCIWLTTEFYQPYALLANDFSRVTNADRGITIASNTIMLLLVTCIMISLSLQVWVVCVTAKPIQRLIVMIATSVAALVAIGFRFAVTVISNKQTMKDDNMLAYSSLITNMYITFAVAVWIYCAIFTFKLGHALLERKRLRMTQFGPMQVIFIMGCQTMVIPAIFTSLNFYDSVPELASQSTTIICIFLPLSAIWAGLVASDANVGSKGPDSHQRLFKDEFYRSPSMSTNPYNDKSHLTNTTFGSGKDRASSSRDPYHQAGDSIDHGIYMQKEWHVEGSESAGPSQQVQGFPCYPMKMVYQS